jgi:hypothetical protein
MFEFQGGLGFGKWVTDLLIFRHQLGWITVIHPHHVKVLAV